MTEQNNHPSNGFWFGFALGTMATGVSLFLFGTKRGRKTVEQMLNLSENFEENALLILEELQEKTAEYVPEINEILKQNNSKKSAHTGISGLLNRINLLSPSHDKQQKKYTKTSS